MKLLAFLSRRLGVLKRLAVMPLLLDAMLMVMTALIRPSVYRRVTRLCSEVRSWPHVAERVHHFGGIQFDCEGRELGHIHGNGIVDLRFRRAVRDELVSAGRALPHHTLPNSGWVTVTLHTDADSEAALEFFRLAYSAARSLPASGRKGLRARQGPIFSERRISPTRRSDTASRRRG